MPTIEGFWPTLLLGALGGLIAELIRIRAAILEGNPPGGVEYFASMLSVVLGAAVVLYGWQQQRTVLEVCQLGAAFPLLFSAGVRAVTTPGDRDLTRSNGARTLVDYVAGRF